MSAMCGQAQAVSAVSAESIGLRAYARARGCSLAAVQRAIRSGRLKGSVLRDSNGRPRIVADVADVEWRNSTLSTREPAAARASREKVTTPDSATENLPRVTGKDGDGQSSLPADSGATEYQRAQTDLARIRARAAELEYQERAGALVSAAAVEATWTDAVVRMRTSLMGVPNRVRQIHPDAPRQIFVTVDAEIRRALEQLAGPEDRPDGQRHLAAED